jgi:ribosomal protein L11 methyltransferase
LKKSWQNNIMYWLELAITTTKDKVDDISTFLELTGSQVISLEDTKDEPIYEPDPINSPLWQNTTIKALFESNYTKQNLTNLLKDKFGDVFLSKCSFNKIIDQNWHEKYLANLKPMYFGEKLAIIPSSEININENKINVLLDPGLAFGTGTHETTALCLEWLDNNLSSEHPQKTILDYGCGSGILSIAALKLGAKHVTAIDIDEQAIESTLNNAQKNSIIDSKIIATTPNYLDKNQQFELCIANILQNTLIELSSKIASHVKQNGQIILSGILTNQADLIIETYSKWFSNFTIEQKQEWVLISAVKS